MDGVKTIVEFFFFSFFFPLNKKQSLPNKLKQTNYKIRISSFNSLYWES